MAYSTAGVFRLVRYSTTPPSDDSELYGTFTGLPIPAAAMAAISMTLCLMSDECQQIFSMSDFTRTMVAVIVFFFLAYLMVSRWRFPSLKSINVRVKSLQLIIAIACASSLVLVVALNNLPLALFLISWGYVLISWTFAIIRLAQGKRRAALDDTEEKEE
jgi:CDP-diacylglycerol--serine O-phosphatidyltransferase